MGNMQAGLETLNQQRCSLGSCHSVGLAKRCNRGFEIFEVQFWQKSTDKVFEQFFVQRGLGAVNTIRRGPKQVATPSCVESFLLKQNL